jgi:sec-independent protein translocase protein TatA
MGFGNLGFGEIFIVLLIVLLLFGAKRIPEIAGSLGKGINSFKRNLGDVERAVREEIPRDETRTERIPAAPLTDQTVVRAEEDRPEPKRLLS